MWAHGRFSESPLLSFIYAIRVQLLLPIIIHHGGGGDNGLDGRRRRG